MLTTFNKPIFFESVRLKGEQVNDFLHNQTTVNFLDFNINQVACAVFCNRQGRVIANAIIMRETTSTWRLIFRNGMVNSWLAAQKVWLKMARIEVVLDNQPQLYHDWRFVSMAPLPMQPEPMQASKQNDVILLHCGAASLSIDINPTSQSAQQSSNTSLMYQYFPHWISPSTTLQFTPAQLKYPAFGLIDFEKGCYLGQEIIARMYYKGKVKQHAVAQSYQRMSQTEWENGSNQYHLDLQTGSLHQENAVPLQIIDGVIIDDTLSATVLLPNLA